MEGFNMFGVPSRHLSNQDTCPCSADTFNSIHTHTNSLKSGHLFSELDTIVYSQWCPLLRGFNYMSHELSDVATLNNIHSINKISKCSRVLDLK